MSVFGRHIQATVVGLNWRRTVVIERGVWESRSTAWKPHGDNVRNIRTVHSVEPDIVGGVTSRRTVVPNVPQNRAHEVMAEHTHFEYEEFNWHMHRSFTAKGDSPADLRWPEYTLESDQRISKRRESYRATFSTDADGGEFTAELDEATWRTLKMGRKYRLKMGAFSDEVKQVTLAGTNYSYRGK
jgi:hypothetical protein